MKSASRFFMPAVLVLAAAAAAALDARLSASGEAYYPAASVAARTTAIPRPDGELHVAQSESAAASTRQPLKLPLTRPRLLVLKARRQLILFAGDEAVRTYPIALGTAPTGDKERQGDRRTPEGNFYVCVKNAQSAYYLSLGLSYPNEEAAARGLRDGLITRAQYGRIMSALRRKRTPPWDTPLGGEIFIHGNGSQGDWTWGCVALDDADMKELFAAVPRGTPVTINP